eukprot:CAMPEP_0119488484 /NCGR_PEP_ID=MMETSP1344-20130328/14249_1 /TAXON_ID=236787 /ORGANISM="Florenciella parvula, Strain CCMP2471" /LENGTH=207 /DNA_ID=CAMNT_0007523441 /DNA_START=67 /DNA_END=690 /DNA_ORIENTATION=+
MARRWRECLAVGDSVEVKEHERWFGGEVTDVNEAESTVKVEYNGNGEPALWFQRDSPKLCDAGTHMAHLWRLDFRKLLLKHAFLPAAHRALEAAVSMSPELRHPGLIKRLLMAVVNMAMGGQSFITRLAQQDTDRLIRRATDELCCGDPDVTFLRTTPALARLVALRGELTSATAIGPAAGAGPEVGAAEPTAVAQPVHSQAQPGQG